eukprot:gene54665-24251_t
MVVTAEAEVQLIVVPPLLSIPPDKRVLTYKEDTPADEFP